MKIALKICIKYEKNSLKIVRFFWGKTGRAMFAGVMEMFARTGVVMLLVPTFGFNGIVFADPTAWVAAVVYITPTCLFVLRKVSRELAGRQETVVSLPEQDRLSVCKSA